MMEELCDCSLCGEKFQKKELKQVRIKGKIKDICSECLATIHGLV
jgi:hypothetical protein